MPIFYVSWEIDIDAENAQEAAETALAIQRDPDSLATIFDVLDSDNGELTQVDLEH